MKKSKPVSTRHSIFFDLNYQLIKYLFLVYILLLVVSCTEKESPSSILERTKEKINNHGLVVYNYQSFWDNKFNDSEFRDTNYIELEKSDANLHDFLFYFSNSSNVDYFDGVIQKEIDHKERRIINHDPDEIASDSSYFMYSVNLTVQPSRFLDIDSTFTSKESTIEGRSVVTFTTVNEEILDTVKITTVSSFVIDKDSSEPWIIKTTSIKEKDTLQVLTHYFQDIEFSNKSIDFAKVHDFVLEQGYAEIAIHQLKEKMGEKQVQIDSKISAAKYQNIFDEETAIFGRFSKKTVLMFSFIGCGGCEYAMKEMKKKNFDFKEDIEFYYSSPNDKSTVLKEYLSKKEFNNIGFGKESKMNEIFNAYIFPTFFILDSMGTITDIYHGYGDDFEDKIF